MTDFMRRIRCKQDGFLWDFCKGITLLVIGIAKSLKKTSIAKYILYLPHILSNVSVVSIYKYFADIGVPYVWELLTGFGDYWSLRFCALTSVGAFFILKERLLCMIEMN